VTLTLHEAADGVAKSVEFHRHEPCNACYGSGAAAGSNPVTCEYCGGHGQVIQQAGIVRVQTTCPSCYGQGAVVKQRCKTCSGEGQTLKRVVTKVQIPAGIDEGMRIRIAGEGEPSPNGGPRGDCYCFVSILQHTLFEREGQHLICRVPITYPQAVLGCKLEVPTLQGRDEVEIPPGTQSGEVFRMTGCGMPDPRRRGLGDLLVQVSIEVPKKISDDEESLLRDLANLENKNVAPHRKSFFERLKEYFTGDENSDESEE
jgi:molecular chaperone DnaJ